MAASKRKAHKQKLKRLEREKSAEVDRKMHQLHQLVFEKIDCLICANCCKTTGPLFTRSDIARISKHLAMKTSDFIATFLRQDDDDDLVLKQVPCAFLDADNACSIYDVRPKACRSYPHTDMDKQKSIFALTLRNAEICPAVYEILETL